MPKYGTQDIRNIALVGHGGSGKTTLVEAMVGGAGEVDKGSTICDFEKEEKDHGHSLNSALVSIDHDGRHINLIDTPGMPDFIGHAMSAFPAVETVAVVVNAQAGIEMITRRMMERAAERKLCRMVIVNKIDAENIDLPGLVDQLREAFGGVCLPINLPAGGGSGVIDVFGKAEGDADFSSVADAHTAIIEQSVEVDEEIAMAYLEGEALSDEQLHGVFERALREGHLVPICFASAKTGVGVPELTATIARMMPSPAEGNPRPFETVADDGAASPLEYSPDPSGAVLAHVFKVTTDPFVGKLGVFRIHQGTVTKDTQLYIGDAKKPFKVGHLFKLHGKDHKETDAGVPGDICAVAKVEDISYNDVLHTSPEHGHVRLVSLSLPVPMAGFAIESKSRGDEQKVAKALAAMEAEDPCFKIERSAESHETVIRGLGELHLRVILEKMKNRYNVEVDTHPPKIAYRETIGGRSEAQYRHKKQTGGAGQFGEVHLRVEPLERGAGFEFANDIFGGSIPGQFIPAIEKGVRQVMGEGCIAGYPMQDIKVSVYDGKYHPVDSKEVAFVTAARKAFQDAVSKARPAILEPIVDLEITVPEHNMGDIAGDLSGKRGRIQGSENIPGGMVVIKAQAPLGELTQYQSQLKSVTGGQGSFTMEFSHYDPVPGNVQQQLASAYKPKADED